MLPAAQKSDRRTFSTISGNSWDLPIHLLRGFGIFSNEFFSGISSSNFGLTRLVALYHHQISWFYYVCAIASFFVEFFFVESFFVACELVDK